MNNVTPGSFVAIRSFDSLPYIDGLGLYIIQLSLSSNMRPARWRHVEIFTFLITKIV